MRDRTKKMLISGSVLLIGVAINYIYSMAIFILFPNALKSFLFSLLGYLPIIITSVIIGFKVWSNKKKKILITVCSLTISYMLFWLSSVILLCLSLINFN